MNVSTEIGRTPICCASHTCIHQICIRDARCQAPLPVADTLITRLYLIQAESTGSMSAFCIAHALVD